MAKKSWLERLKRGPKFSTRQKNRCSQCGRARAFIRRFGICRICFRKLAHNALLPGVTKSSW
ncbi:MAG: type Z 30S ribosomal protein S14 [bacterium]